MPRFKHYNYDQDAMVVINYQEQLQPGTFEHAVHYLIEHKLDLSVFQPRYRNEDTGWRARRAKRSTATRCRWWYPFGNIGTNKGLNRFSLRSKKKIQGQ